MSNQSEAERQEPAPTIEDLEQEIYQNTRNFVSLDVMEWMLKRYYTHPQPKQDNTELDAICQDLQEKTYTQAMRIAELEAKLTETEKHEVSQEPVTCQHKRYSIDVAEQIGTCIDCGSEGRMRFVVDDTHPQPKREPLTLGQKQRLWSKVGEKPTLKDRVNAFGLEIEAAHGIKGERCQ